MTGTKVWEISIYAWSQSCFKLKYPWYFSLRNASRYNGGDLTYRLSRCGVRLATQGKTLSPERPVYKNTVLHQYASYAHLPHCLNLLTLC